MLFFVCFVGYEYAMCNFTPNKCYVMLYTIQILRKGMSNTDKVLAILR